MSFTKWHKKQVEKNLNMFGLSTYQGFWISFIKGLIFGAIIMWFVGCKEQVVIKKAPTAKLISPYASAVGSRKSKNVSRTTVKILESILIILQL